MFTLLYLTIVCISIYCGSYVTAADDTKPNECYACRGITCLRTTARNISETCIYDLDVCVTVFDKFTVTARGCLLNIPAELRTKCNHRSSLECQICSNKLCNNLGRSDFTCYQCSEKDDSSCAENIDTLVPVQCEIPLSPNSYCFAEQTSDGYVKRGCSLTVKDQDECLMNKKCNLCLAEDGQGCNRIQIEKTSRGFVKSAVVGLVALCLTVTAF